MREIDPSADLPPTHIHNGSDTHHSAITNTGTNQPSTVDSPVQVVQIDERSTVHGSPWGEMALIPGARVGNYVLEKKIAKGGMGLVFKARHVKLDRLAAVKVLRSGVMAEEGEIERFELEAKAVAQLDHPNIVRVYEFSVHHELPYLAMSYVAGGSLDRYRNQFLHNAPATARLIAKLARAVQHAHDHDILHRDLKPANILMDEQGEPKITDFGLAKFLSLRGNLTDTGAVLGTPAYMAPEQAAGHGDQIGRPTDVWALGVILYELLTGQRPFSGNSREEVTPRILNTEPARPRVLDPKLPKPLETVVLKCLAKRPEDRYPSCTALADDLERWARGDRIGAKPEPRWRVWLRQAWRLPTVRVATWLVPLFAVLLVAGLWIMQSQMLPAQPEELTETQRQESARMVADLKAGKPVDLLHPDGRPRFGQWQTVAYPVLTDPTEPGACTLEALESGMLELLPSVPVENYRIKLEVRHNSKPSGNVGAYVGHVFHAAPDGKGIHSFAGCRYSDLLDSTENAAAAPVTHALRFNLERLGRHGFLQTVDHYAQVTQVQFVPAGGPFGSWRSVAVTVHPNRFEVAWEGQPVLNVPRDSGYERAAGMIHGKWSAKYGLPPSFPPKGGVGLLTHSASATFRKVILEPIPPGQ